MNPDLNQIKYALFKEEFYNVIEKFGKSIFERFIKTLNHKRQLVIVNL